ncbi:MAG: hypothetical protein K0R39_4097 [Symbiobacteriaceae bacterium]|jgi:hypothetical protein|nr:hypothetical protein [Symbiobacteriaceae bacterium]
MIIYHSRGAYPGRLAAAIAAGLLPPEPPPGRADLAAALAALGGPGAMQAEGLWAAGMDRQGRRIYALGRASRPDVVERAFASLAGLAGLAPGCFALQAVGRPVAWNDLLARVLQFLRLQGAADRVRLAGLRRAWGEAAWAAAGAAVAKGPAPPPSAPAPSRNLIYFCYGGSHSSVTAANIHLGRLPASHRARPKEILRQPLFDQARNQDLGLIRHMGTDEAGNAIHVVGLAGGKAVLSRALAELLALSGVPVADFRFEPTLQNAGIILRLGGYASRGLGWVAVGRPVCALGVWLKYPLYGSHVKEVRRKLGLTVLPPSDIID